MRTEYIPVEQKRHKKHEKDHWRLLDKVLSLGLMIKTMIQLLDLESKTYPNVFNQVSGNEQAKRINTQTQQMHLSLKF